ncbi:MAG: single-stranded DNA-binding protein [Candidatus Nanopelagicales bacterium]
MQSSVTLVGNVVSDVRVRDTPGGTVASFRIAADNSYFDRRTERWVERSTFFWVSVWRGLAENVAASVAKGQPVVVVGRPKERSYERDGQQVTVVEVDAELVGHNLTRGRASFERVRRGPQTSTLLREVEAAAASRVEVPDTLPTEWAVPGVTGSPEVGSPPAA